MKRSTVCEKFLEKNEVNCCTIRDNDDEGHFSWRGCDCCETGLGNHVYDCVGYSTKHKVVLVLGQVCAECIYYFYNGDDSEVIQCRTN